MNYFKRRKGFQNIIVFAQYFCQERFFTCYFVKFLENTGNYYYKRKIMSFNPIKSGLTLRILSNPPVDKMDDIYLGVPTHELKSKSH